MILPLLLALTLQTDSLHFPPVLREFRGVWVATIDNVDWPSQPGLTVLEQQAELLKIPDGAQALKNERRIFQARRTGLR